MIDTICTYTIRDFIYWTHIYRYYYYLSFSTEGKQYCICISEPTNMLDMKAIIWLEDYLQTWPTTILVVSHDRLFLNSVVTNVAHMHSERLDMYSGDYEKFAITRVEKLKNQQKEYEAQKQYREHIQVSQ